VASFQLEIDRMKMLRLLGKRRVGSIQQISWWEEAQQMEYVAFDYYKLYTLARSPCTKTPREFG
jgi:hypothetical protein